MKMVEAYSDEPKQRNPRFHKNYRSGTVNSNTVNSKFHLIRSYCEIFVYNCPNTSCLKYTVNSNFHLIQSKTLPTNDFELTVPDLYFRSSVDGHLILLSLTPWYILIDFVTNFGLSMIVMTNLHLHFKTKTLNRTMCKVYLYRLHT